MAIKKIEKNKWKAYFDSFSKKYLKDEEPEYAEVRVFDDSMGAQQATKWVLLNGITYDEKGDLLDIRLEDSNRIIHHPKEIYVSESREGWILNLEVIQKDGTKNIIETR
ncbi:DUF5335 family protein [Fodinibius halophilus]|uniref:DUF5335 family protein n=1 Tax=Fodinibius halophilus TaxID=1736908 RepID=A0A6M1T1D9_9BACT|nr:DUF5335 family protein [Fodinibius halophilus]NGP89888.1 DUF5335 family protein [Fodinibius halophilus]